jgi:hypothetical protein
MPLQTYSSKDPKLILAVPASFSHAPSRLLFADFALAAVPDNVILLTIFGLSDIPSNTSVASGIRACLSALFTYASMRLFGVSFRHWVLA